MNLPEYPAIPKDHNAGEEMHVSDYLANFPSWQTQTLDAPAMIDGNLKEESSFGWTSATSFLAGMLVAIVVMQLVNGQSRSRQQGYQAIPEASLGQD